MRWQLIGIDFNNRWRSGATRLDLNGDCIVVHHGFYNLEWARGPHVEHFCAFRKSFFSR